VVGSTFNEPVAGGQVTFTGPASGPGIQSSPLTATIGVGSVASVTPSANAAAGSFTVAVGMAGGPSPAPTFSLANAPILSGIAPASGGAAGGSKVTFTGAGFGAVPPSVQVLVGGTAIPAGSIVSVTDTQIVYLAPAHAAGTAGVGVKVGGVAAAASVNYTFGTVTALPSPEPPGASGGSPGPQPGARPAGSASGGSGSPGSLPAPRP
jgi:hypothetical protein